MSKIILDVIIWNVKKVSMFANYDKKRFSWDDGVCSYDYGHGYYTDFQLLVNAEIL